MTSAWRFEALGTTVAVTADALLDTSPLQVLLAGYTRSNRSADSSYAFQTKGGLAHLTRDGRDLYSGSEGDALNFFLIDLYRSLAGSADNGWLLHAAAVVKDEEVLVLAGPSNAGKSTMTRGLLREGWGYLSEEMVTLSPGRIDGLRRPLHAAAPETLRGIVGFGEPCAVVAGSETIWVAAPLGPALTGKHIKAIVRLYYQPQEETSLQRLNASQALLELWPCRMNSGITRAEMAAQLVSAVPCYRLSAANETSALRHLGDL